VFGCRSGWAVTLISILIPYLGGGPAIAVTTPDSDQKPVGDLNPAVNDNEGGMELPLLQESKPKKISKKVKKKVKKTRYPYSKHEFELDLRRGWDNNVFRSADIYLNRTREDLEPQSDSFARYRLDYSWDKYLSKNDKFSLDYYYYGKFYDDLEQADTQKHSLRLEWRKRIADKQYVIAGVREWRRFNVATDRFGNELKSDLDYFRTDLYLEYQLEPLPEHTLQLEYRFVNKDYDETRDPTDQSIDWREHRFITEIERDYGNHITASAWIEERWRDYSEKLARDDLGDKIEGVLRSQRRDLAGLRVERPLCRTAMLGIEVEYDKLTDPYRGYYSYQGLNYRADVEWHLSPRLVLEIEGKLYQRDHDKRRFLASYMPNPFPPPKHLDPLITLYEDYRLKGNLTFLYSERLELYCGLYHRWYHVNDPTEEFQDTQIYAGLKYYLGWKNRPERNKDRKQEERYQHGGHP
jgi:hypothetical protein